jgi:RNA polymerase sigma-70 factor, ECF subfamily
VPRDRTSHSIHMKPSRSLFDSLVLPHMEMLYRLARRMTGDFSSAEDLVQETYVHAYKSLDSFELKEFGVRPWLIQILRNLTTSRFRREKLMPRAIDDEQLATVEGSATANDDAQSFSFDGMDQRLAKAVKELSSENQQILWLWAVQGLSYKELAAALQSPIGTIMSRLHRVREKLVARLSAKGVDAPGKLE